MTCPLCGAPLHSERLLVDLNTNVIHYNGRCFEVREPRAAELLYVLAQCWPRVATYDHIEDGVWGNSVELVKPHATISLYVHRARPLLARLGIQIQNIFGQGYRLVLPTQQVFS